MNNRPGLLVEKKGGKEETKSVAKKSFNLLINCLFVVVFVLRIHNHNHHPLYLLITAFSLSFNLELAEAPTSPSNQALDT